ncbi:helix-turn-helix domain-containing protein [Metabacillus iocasae]|uniref:DNA-directed RNA polymerase specialized sigma subunit n=1 Tax=Priestia iocasae TaxID=2291674 RepID=A0ABS2QVA7_9BACI|nr:helix-turn-helix domain-containing protein [Metabacillus iocasae]MBM7702409.1 DNA-directed RNA polymerase specialized sigma subunit [Metabacillus iocasae]
MRLVELMKRAQFGDEEAMQQLLNLFEPKIKQCVKYVPYQDREDIEQAIRLEMILAIRKFDFQSTPTFWEML